MTGASRRHARHADDRVAWSVPSRLMGRRERRRGNRTLNQPPMMSEARRRPDDRPTAPRRPSMSAAFVRKPHGRRRDDETIRAVPVGAATLSGSNSVNRPGYSAPRWTASPGTGLQAAHPRQSSWRQYLRGQHLRCRRRSPLADQRRSRLSLRPRWRPQWRHQTQLRGEAAEYPISRASRVSLPGNRSRFWAAKEIGRRRALRARRPGSGGGRRRSRRRSRPRPRPVAIASTSATTASSTEPSTRSPWSRRAPIRERRPTWRNG